MKDIASLAREGKGKRKKERQRETERLPLSIENCVSLERVHLEGDEFYERFSFIEQRKRRDPADFVAFGALLNILDTAEALLFDVRKSGRSLAHRELL